TGRGTSTADNTPANSLILMMSHRLITRPVMKSGNQQRRRDKRNAAKKKGRVPDGEATPQRKTQRPQMLKQRSREGRNAAEKKRRLAHCGATPQRKTHRRRETVNVFHTAP